MYIYTYVYIYVYTFVCLYLATHGLLSQFSFWGLSACLLVNHWPKSIFDMFLYDIAFFLEQIATLDFTDAFVKSLSTSPDSLQQQQQQQQPLTAIEVWMGLASVYTCSDSMATAVVSTIDTDILRITLLKPFVAQLHK